MEKDSEARLQEFSLAERKRADQFLRQFALILVVAGITGFYLQSNYFQERSLGAEISHAVSENRDGEGCFYGTVFYSKSVTFQRYDEGGWSFCEYFFPEGLPETLTVVVKSPHIISYEIAHEDQVAVYYKPPVDWDGRFQLKAPDDVTLRVLKVFNNSSELFNYRDGLEKAGKQVRICFWGEAC